MKLPTKWMPAFVGEDLKFRPEDEIQPKCLKCVHCTHYGVWKNVCNGLPLSGRLTGCDKFEDGEEFCAKYDIKRGFSENFQGIEPSCIGCMENGHPAPRNKTLKAIPGKKCTYCYKMIPKNKNDD